jgi:hypothetical protein
MKRALLICCIFALASIRLSCTPEAALGISVTETEDGVLIEDTGNTDYIVFVTSPDGEQQHELAVGKNVTVTGI